MTRGIRDVPPMQNTLHLIYFRQWEWIAPHEQTSHNRSKLVILLDGIKCSIDTGTMSEFLLYFLGVTCSHCMRQHHCRGAIIEVLGRRCTQRRQLHQIRQLPVRHPMSDCTARLINAWIRGEKSIVNTYWITPLWRSPQLCQTSASR